MHLSSIIEAILPELTLYECQRLTLVSHEFNATISTYQSEILKQKYVLKWIVSINNDDISCHYLKTLKINTPNGKIHPHGTSDPFPGYAHLKYDDTQFLSMIQLKLYKTASEYMSLMLYRTEYYNDIPDILANDNDPVSDDFITFVNTLLLKYKEDRMGFLANIFFNKPTPKLTWLFNAMHASVNEIDRVLRIYPFEFETIIYWVEDQISCVMRMVRSPEDMIRLIEKYPNIDWSSHWRQNEDMFHTPEYAVLFLGKCDSVQLITSVVKKCNNAETCVAFLRKVFDYNLPNVHDILTALNDTRVLSFQFIIDCLKEYYPDIEVKPYNTIIHIEESIIRYNQLETMTQYYNKHDKTYILHYIINLFIMATSIEMCDMIFTHYSPLGSYDMIKITCAFFKVGASEEKLSWALCLIGSTPETRIELYQKLFHATKTKLTISQINLLIRYENSAPSAPLESTTNALFELIIETRFHFGQFPYMQLVSLDKQQRLFNAYSSHGMKEALELGEYLGDKLECHARNIYTPTLFNTPDVIDTCVRLVSISTHLADVYLEKNTHPDFIKALIAKYPKEDTKCIAKTCHWKLLFDSMTTPEDRKRCFRAQENNQGFSIYKHRDIIKLYKCHLQYNIEFRNAMLKSIFYS